MPLNEGILGTVREGCLLSGKCSEFSFSPGHAVSKTRVELVFSGNKPQIFCSNYYSGHCLLL